jgi:hypothetical protein
MGFFVKFARFVTRSAKNIQLNGIVTGKDFLVRPELILDGDHESSGACSDGGLLPASRQGYGESWAIPARWFPPPQAMVRKSAELGRRSSKRR